MMNIRRYTIPVLILTWRISDPLLRLFRHVRQMHDRHPYVCQDLDNVADVYCERRCVNASFYFSGSVEMTEGSSVAQSRGVSIELEPGRGSSLSSEEGSSSAELRLALTSSHVLTPSPRADRYG
jgi:hypothetical protein